MPHDSERLQLGRFMDNYELRRSLFPLRRERVSAVGSVSNLRAGAFHLGQFWMENGYGLAQNFVQTKTLRDCAAMLA